MVKGCVQGIHSLELLVGAFLYSLLYMFFKFNFLFVLMFCVFRMAPEVMQQVDGYDFKYVFRTFLKVYMHSNQELGVA